MTEEKNGKVMVNCLTQNHNSKSQFKINSFVPLFVPDIVRRPDTIDDTALNPYVLANSKLVINKIFHNFVGESLQNSLSNVFLVMQKWLDLNHKSARQSVVADLGNR